MTTHETEPNPTTPSTMQAIVQNRYGRPDVLDLRTIATPSPGAEQVLVRVAASSLNQYDWHLTTGTPFMARAMAGWAKPKHPTPGADVAGVVVAVGEQVSDFEVGDEVFGAIGMGAFAEYAVTKSHCLTPRPAGVSFAEAASIPLAAITALQGLRDIGGLQAGQRVIINGASGGVGTLAVQIAKALGAEVTAVCSTTKIETARSLGANHVIDYTAADYTESERGYHVLFDNAGDRPWSETSRVLTEGGINVTITGPKHAIVGPLRALALRRVQSMFSSKRFAWFTASVKRTDLDTLAGMLTSGDVIPVIEDRYPLDRMPEALRRLSDGHAAGKLVIEVAS